jgi:hypothetical protein
MLAEPTLDKRSLWSPFFVSRPVQTGKDRLPDTSYPFLSMPFDPDSDAARAARVAENESIFRQANEQLEQRFRELEAEGPTPFLCECGDTACTRTIRLSLDEYEAVRARAAHFAIIPGHQILDAERIVEENERYGIVEKLDVGRRIAEARDPR